MYSTPYVHILFLIIHVIHSSKIKVRRRLKTYNKSSTFYRNSSWISRKEIENGNFIRIIGILVITKRN
jgi:hypothetical protein